MALEIERRFLIESAKIPELPNRKVLKIVQGYLTGGVRVRRVDNSYLSGSDYPEAFLTIKKNISHGTNKEFEYEIPSTDGDELIEMCEFKLSKFRYHYPVGKHIFEIDLFKGTLDGLIIAEVELLDIKEPVDIPSWFSQEITGNKFFSNYSLAANLDPLGILNESARLIKKDTIFKAFSNG